MEFGISLETSLEIDKSNIIHDLSSKLTKYFDKRNYGNGIKVFTIGIICVKPEFDFFFKIRKPKYIKGKKTLTHDGISIEIENSYEYDIKLNYGQFLIANTSESKNILVDKLLESINLLNKQKIKDFDFNKFIDDFKSFCKDYLSD